MAPDDAEHNSASRSPEVGVRFLTLSSLCASVVRCRRKLPFFVEPILVLYFFCEFPVDAINQRYTLDWIGKYLIPNDDDNVTATSGSNDRSTCSINGSAAATSRENRIQSLASWFAIIEAITWGLPAVVISLLLSSSSDRFGRRFAIIPPLVGAVCSSVASFVIVRFEGPIIWFLVRDLAYGFCGSFLTITAACFGYISDRTPVERRMMRLTVVQMVMLMSGVVSPIGLGLLVTRIGYSNCLLIVVSLSSINLAYVLAFMPIDIDGKTSTERQSAVGNESTSGAAVVTSPSRVVGRSEEGGASPYNVNCTEDDPAYPRRDDVKSLTTGQPETQRQPAAGSSMVNSTAVDAILAEVVIPITSGQPPRVYTFCTTLSDGVGRVVGLFSLHTADGRRWKMCTLIVVFFVVALPTYNFSIQTLFAMNHPLCWTLSEVGFFIGVSLGISTAGGLITAPLLKRCISDVAVAILAALTCMATNVFKGFVKNTAMMYTSNSLNMFNILLLPSVRSMMSCLVGDHEQGAVFGGIASVEVICSVLGTVIFNAIYSSTLNVSTGFVFFAMAAFYAVGCCTMIGYSIQLFLERRATHDTDSLETPVFEDEDQERVLVT